MSLLEVLSECSSGVGPVGCCVARRMRCKAEGAKTKSWEQDVW